VVVGLGFGCSGGEVMIKMKLLTSILLEIGEVRIILWIKKGDSIRETISLVGGCEPHTPHFSILNIMGSLSFLRKNNNICHLIN
jgi:hypothetical protein